MRRHRIVIAMGWALLAVAAAPTARAQGLHVARDEATYEFASSLDFELEAVSPARAEEATLRFVVGRDSPVNRRVVAIEPGTRIEARHHESLARGQVPPATAITWWWTLADASGRELVTPRRTIVYLDRSFDWRSLDAGDVRVWYYGDGGDEAPGIAEEARGVVARLSELLGPPPERRIEIVIYEDQDDMRPALVARGEIYEGRLATLGARVAPDVLLLDAGTRPDDLYEVLAHELTHVVFHLHFAGEYLDAPSWLDEGLAMYSEGPLDAGESARLRRAVREDELIPVRSLTSFPGETELVELAYAQSREVVAFLIERDGEDAFRRLTDAVAQGRVPTDRALRDVYGFDQLGLYQEYRKSVGLGPATPPPPGAVEPARRGAARVPDAGCATALLAVPAMAVGMRRRHDAARRARHDAARRARHDAARRARHAASLHARSR